MIKIVNNLYKDYIDIEISEKIEKFIDMIDISFSNKYLNYKSDIVKISYSHFYIEKFDYLYHKIVLTHLDDCKINLFFIDLKYVFSEGGIEYHIYDMESIYTGYIRDNNLKILLQNFYI